MLVGYTLHFFMIITTSSACSSKDATFVTTVMVITGRVEEEVGIGKLSKRLRDCGCGKEGGAEKREGCVGGSYRVFWPGVESEELGDREKCQGSYGSGGGAMLKDKRICK